MGSSEQWIPTVAWLHRTAKTRSRMEQTWKRQSPLSSASWSFQTQRQTMRFLENAHCACDEETMKAKQQGAAKVPRQEHAGERRSSYTRGGEESYFLVSFVSKRTCMSEKE